MGPYIAFSDQPPLERKHLTQMRTYVLIGAAAALTLGATPLAAASASPTATPAVAPVAATTGAYVSVKPARILDTRYKIGVPAVAPVAAGQTVSLQVAGRGGVPTSGVSAVVLNLTVVTPSLGGYLTAYPAGQSLPTTSSLNFVKGATRANLVTVPLGTGGKLAIRNAGGNTNLLGDVVGYYLDGSTSAVTGSYGSYQSFQPFRAYDSRSDDDRKPVVAGEYVTVPLDLGPDDSMHVKAVAVTVTAVNPTRGGYLTAWAGDSNTLPKTSTLNYLTGQNTPNMTIVPVTTCTDCGAYPMTSFDVDNVGGTTHLLVDVVGFFDDDTFGSGLRFKPLSAPKRIVDTRSNLGMSKIGAGQTKTAVAPATIAGPTTGSLVANVTGVRPTASTYLTLWPNFAGETRPTVSNLNPAKGAVAANMAILDLGPAGDFNVFNGSGTTDVLVDVTGTMEFYAAAAAGAPASGPAHLQSGEGQRPVSAPVRPAVGTHTR